MGNETNNQGQPMKVGGTTCACGDGCTCGCGCGYGHHWGSGYNILRWVVGIFILFFVFALGVKLGEFLTEWRSIRAASRFNNGMMMNRGGYGGGYGGGYVNPGGPMIPANGTSTVQSQ